MEDAKSIIGLLNSTLKGIRIVTKETASIQSAELIAKGLLMSIDKKSIAIEFISYVKETYDIIIEY